MKGLKDGVPLVYWTFRGVWSTLHVLLVLAGATALFWWGFSDGNAVRLWTGFWEGLLDLQQRVASIVPWPWPFG